MSATGEHAEGTIRGERSALAEIVHSLNQPLTGLQCCLELALAAPRTAEQYACTLREGVELTARMRTLVGALRELGELEAGAGKKPAAISLGRLLERTISELQPIAESAGIRVVVRADDRISLRASQRNAEQAAFRLLDSVLSLGARHSTIRITAENQAVGSRLDICWEEDREGADAAKTSPWLELQLARAAWIHMGASWSAETLAGGDQRISIGLPRNQADVAPENRTGEMR